MSKIVRIILFTIHCSLFTVLLVSCATTPDIEDIKRAEVYYKLGISHLIGGRLADAFIEFQKAIKLNPKDKDSLNALGLISTEFEKYDEALSYYRQAIAIEPNYSEAMNNMGVTYVRMERWDEAIEYFRMALKNPLYPTPERAYTNMGYAFYKKGDYVNAMSAIKNALVRYPDFPRALYVSGLIHVKLGNDNQAIEEFKKAVAVDLEYIEGHWELGSAYLRVGDKKKAIEHFKVVFEKSDDIKRRKEALEYIELLKGK